MNDINVGYLFKVVESRSVELEECKNIFATLPKDEQECFLLNGNSKFIDNEMLDTWRLKCRNLATY